MTLETGRNVARSVVSRRLTPMSDIHNISDQRVTIFFSHHVLLCVSDSQVRQQTEEADLKLVRW